MVIQRCDVTVGEVYGRGLGKVMQLVFNDGSAIEVDTQIGQPIGKLIEGLAMSPRSLTVAASRRSHRDTFGSELADRARVDFSFGAQLLKGSAPTGDGSSLVSP